MIHQQSYIIHFNSRREYLQMGINIKLKKSEGKFYSEPDLKIYHNYYQILLDIITVNYYQKYRY